MTTKQYEDSSHVVMSIELLLCEILSRLPVKPLMRFKCVCKQWQSLIHKDRNFIDLHFKRSKTSNFCVAVDDGGISLFIKVFSSAKLLPSEGRVAAVQREVPKPGTDLTDVFGAVNRLLSLVDSSTHYVCVFNPSTGQSTPWVQPMIKQRETIREKIQVIDEDGHHVTHEAAYVNRNWYYFGYDPATKEHKVVCIWKKMVYKSPGGFLRAENICEVMTIDGRQHNNNLSWRRIDGELSIPPTISPFDFSSSVYANGSIYWLRTLREPLIVEFNVGSEKFRVIPIPNYIVEEIHYPYKSKLIQIDGCLAVLAKTTTCITDDTPSMKMCVLYDKKLKDNIGNTVTSTSSAVSNSGNFYWIQETFMMPHSDWARLEFGSIQAVPGTDLLIIRSDEEEKAGSRFYFFDWKNQSFSEESFFIAQRMTSSFTPYSIEYSVYNESILPVI